MSSFFPSAPRRTWGKILGQTTTTIAAVLGLGVLINQLGPCDLGWKFETKAEAKAAHQPMQERIEKLEANDQESLRLLKEILKEVKR
jgi:hypothetical protein